MKCECWWTWTNIQYKWVVDKDLLCRLCYSKCWQKRKIAVADWYDSVLSIPMTVGLLYSHCGPICWRTFTGFYGTGTAIWNWVMEISYNVKVRVLLQLNTKAINWSLMNSNIQNMHTDILYLNCFTWAWPSDCIVAKYMHNKDKQRLQSFCGLGNVTYHWEKLRWLKGGIKSKTRRKLVNKYIHPFHQQ